MKHKKNYFYICEGCKEAIPQRIDNIKNMKWILCRYCANKKRARDNREKIRNATLRQMKEGNWVLKEVRNDKVCEEKRIKSFSKTMKRKYANGEITPWNKGKRGKGMPRYIDDRSKLKEPLNKQIRGSIEMKNWKKKIFKRDKYTCQICHEKSGKINAHHIKSFKEYSKERFNIDNGITLCEICHKWIHNLDPLNFQ